ncbi:MAG TPA: VOC family protein, partial [Hyphomicrobium sp.]
MKKLAMGTTGRASPGLRYKNVGAAIEFLCNAFGCEVRSAETDPDGSVSYAELSFGNTIIMVGAVSGFDIDRFMKQPGEIGGAETQCCYYVVDDVDMQYVKARRAGCEIVIDMQTLPNGGRSFTCRDI